MLASNANRLCRRRGDECAWECGAFGDVLKVREEGGVMAGRTLILK